MALGFSRLSGYGVLGFTAGRTATAAWFSRKSIHVVLIRGGDGGGRILQP